MVLRLLRSNRKACCSFYSVGVKSGSMNTLFSLAWNNLLSFRDDRDAVSDGWKGDDDDASKAGASSGKWVGFLGCDTRYGEARRLFGSEAVVLQPGCDSFGGFLALKFCGGRWCTDDEGLGPFEAVLLLADDRGRQADGEGLRSFCKDVFIGRLGELLDLRNLVVQFLKRLYKQRGELK